MDGVVISPVYLEDFEMATNKPTGDNARKGAVRKRTQLRTKTMGESTWTKRDKTTGKFMDQKKVPANKFKGVRREKKAG
jgi:hypothetical protein